jgi:hypothetical protein
MDADTTTRTTNGLLRPMSISTVSMCILRREIPTSPRRAEASLLRLSEYPNGKQVLPHV